MRKTMWIKSDKIFLIIFLLMFMLLIFGPAEIFFANSVEFPFLYQEFAIYLFLFAVTGAVLLTILISLLPEKGQRIFLSIISAISIAGYVQVMFLNKGLDLLGLNPDGYQVDTVRKITNLLIWLATIGICLLLAFLRKELWTKIIVGVSAFLLVIQLVAFVSLMVTADPGAYKRNEGWRLSGAEQYTVSSKENVIVFVLDYFSNKYVAPTKAIYPDAFDCLHDFTYYNNMDCVYFGTYPSLNHMLTGEELDLSVTTNEWCKKCWNSQNAENFYSGLADRNYKVNVYTPDSTILCGTNGVEILQDKISNAVDSAQEVEVRHKMLCRTITKMSCYRFAPEILKPFFYTDMGEYTNTVVEKDNPIRHENAEFFDQLKTQGLTVDDSSNYFIVQHLVGTHAYNNDAMGNYSETKTTEEETAKGCMVILESYLNKLKELGCYDDATIIVTSDHGGYDDSQPIFWMKQPEEQHEISPESNAPTTFCEFLPTLAQAVGMDAKEFGDTIYDIEDGTERERIVWRREYDPAYPKVKTYFNDNESQFNVYCGYKYVGNVEYLLDSILEGPDQTIAMTDSYF